MLTVEQAAPYPFFFYPGVRNAPPLFMWNGMTTSQKFGLIPCGYKPVVGLIESISATFKRLLKSNNTPEGRHGMSTSVVNRVKPMAQHVTVTEDTLSVDLGDGRSISVPTAWYPRLVHATPEEQKNWRLIGKGEGIHWEDLDEDISIEGLLEGQPSGKSQTSFKKWLEKRASPQ